MSSEMVLSEAMRELASYSSTMAGWGPAVANHLWQSTVFGVAAAVLTLALRRNRAASRYWLWLVASLKFAVPFALLMAVGERMTAPRVVAPAVSQVYFAMEPLERPFVAASAFIPSVVTYSPARRMWRDVLPVALAAVWACGVIFLLLRWALRWLQIRRIVRGATVAEEGREVAVLRRLVEAATFGRRVELRLSASSMGPGIVGVWRPVLLWPAGISERLTDEHVEAIVAHELTHVRRRDNLTAALHMVVEAAFWFHPLVWWAGRQMMEERERACDEAAMELGSNPRAYAESILRVCEFCLEAPLECVSGISAAGLKARLREIMSGRARVRLSWVQRVGLVCAACVAVAAPVLSGQGRAMQRLAQKAMPEAVLARIMPAVKAASGPVPLEMAAPLAMQIESKRGKNVAVIESAQRPTVDGAEVQAQAAGMRLVSLPQSEPVAKKPRAFEVVSIRPVQPDAHQTRALGVPITPDGISVRHVSLDTLIKVAYFPVDFRRWTPHMLQSEPEWAFEQYDIEAKVSDTDRAEWQKQGSWNEDNKMLREMLRTMLAERFKLVVHPVAGETDGWYIEVGKNGPKLTETKPDEKLPTGIAVVEGGVEVLTSGPSDHPHIELYGVSMAGLAGQLSFLSMAAGQPVEDHTGLTGKYNLALYCLDPRKGYCVTDTEDTNPLSQWDVQSLGLKLVPHKTQTNSIYIDHVEKPTEN